MRIALVSTVSAPVREDSGGSVEAWTWLLARELGSLGHTVTVFGCAGSQTSAELVATVPGPYGTHGGYDDWQLCEWINLTRAVSESRRFDVLHAQAYLWGMPLQSLCAAPMVHTLHIVPDDNAVRLWAAHPDSRVTAISRHQWSGRWDGFETRPTPVAIIPHGLDVSQFTLRTQPEDYLLYLGRFTSGKGPIQAINMARALGIRLLLAGPESAYFREKVQPLLDGKTAEYVGYAPPAKRNQLLGGARALLYPIQYPEAFGLVLVEAMLCGTPVAAMRFGAVPEIVAEGVSGFTAENEEQLAEVLPRCFTLDRAAIRREAERRFSAEKMARAYASVYAQVCAAEPMPNF